MRVGSRRIQIRLLRSKRIRRPERHDGQHRSDTVRSACTDASVVTIATHADRSGQFLEASSYPLCPSYTMSHKSSVPLQRAMRDPDFLFGRITVLSHLMENPCHAPPPFLPAHVWATLQSCEWVCVQTTGRVFGLVSANRQRRDPPEEGGGVLQRYLQGSSTRMTRRLHTSSE